MFSNSPPVFASQALMIRSSAVENRRLPSGLKMTAPMRPKWPERMCNVAPVLPSPRNKGVGRPTAAVGLWKS
jgi:hypothetical protein